MFSVGDFVEIRPGVHDDQMPLFRRDGHIVEIVGKRRDQAMILFSNNNILKFHFCQIERLYNQKD